MHLARAKSGFKLSPAKLPKFSSLKSVMALDLRLEFYFCVASLLMIIAGANERNVSSSSKWPPSQQAIRIDGDVMIGGLLRVHQSSARYVCGQLLLQSGIQSVEALLYALDTINNGSILPGFTMGLLAFDDCNQEGYSLEQSVKFVRRDQGFVFDGEERYCADNDSAVETRSSPDGRSRVTGVVGASSSACTVQVASLLKLFKIPQVKYPVECSIFSINSKHIIYLQTLFFMCA